MAASYITINPKDQVSYLVVFIHLFFKMRIAAWTHHYEHGVGMTVNHRLVNVETNNDVLQATFFNEFNHSTIVREARQIVVEHGTLPNDELYFSLKEHSLNLGITDYDALAENRPQTAVSNHRGKFQLFRVGDAVASRNIHAAIYDSLRICKDI